MLKLVPKAKKLLSVCALSQLWSLLFSVVTLDTPDTDLGC